MADDVDKMNLAFDRVLESFKLKNLKDSQRDALEKLVGGQDVFVIQPTGSGKSLIFQSAPIVLDTIRPLSNAKSIALVISPLASLMQDQVRYLKSVGIKAEFIEDEQENEHAKHWHRRRINYIFSITSQTRSTGHASSRLSSGRIKDRTQETAEIEPNL